MKWKIGKLIPRLSLLLVFMLGVLAVFMARAGMDAVSTDAYCESCHVHPQATQSWKLSMHHDTESGVTIHCVDCHLPPGGFHHVWEKSKAGVRDVYGVLFKDVDKIDWEEKSRRENAIKFVFKESCIHCHQNLYPRGLSKKGADAHLHYDRHADELRCLNCHIDVGHFQEKPVEQFTLKQDTERIIYTQAARVTEFKNFTETVPGTSVQFDMVAIPGDEFIMGSPASEPFREDDEGPQRRVLLSPFWVGKAEVSWMEYDAFTKATGGEGRTEDQVVSRRENAVDGITGPTPAYGNPDQGWGRSNRPAITMTWYAANVYCQWLTSVTGKKYRLPTEAEWEYAARKQAKGAYFFDGNPRKYSNAGFWNQLFGADTSVINSYAVYAANSNSRTQPRNAVLPNGFGIQHMLGNVREFCADWYAQDAYAQPPEGVVKNPQGPVTGQERVIRGGAYNSDAAQLRISARDKTQHEAWMRTDPQIPKSLWWYSDNADVGFRVVCEYDSATMTDSR